MGETTAPDALDGAVRVTKSKLAGQVHIGLARETFIQETQRGIVLRNRQPVDDSPSLVAANHHLEPSCRKQFSRGRDCSLAAVPVFDQLYQLRWRIVAIAIARKPQHVRAVWITIVDMLSGTRPAARSGSRLCADPV